MRTVKRYCRSCTKPFEFKASWEHKLNAGRYCSVRCRADATRARTDSRSVRQQISESVELDPTTGCWLWARATTNDGYGNIKREGFSSRAHRASWEVNRGPIPAGLHVLHRCDTPACVNPDHLRLGTHRQNMEDMARRGRGRSGAKSGHDHPRAKVTREMAAEIRRRHVRFGGRDSSEKLSAELRVSETTVRRHARAAPQNSGMKSQ